LPGNGSRSARFSAAIRGGLIEAQYAAPDGRETLAAPVLARGVSPRTASELLAA